MVRFRLSDNAEDVLSMVDEARAGFAEHLGISVDIMNHIFSKGHAYWKFCIGNRDKIEVRRVDNSKNIEYVIKSKQLVLIRDRAKNKGFFQLIRDYFKNDVLQTLKGLVSNGRSDERRTMMFFLMQNIGNSEL